MDTVYLKRLNYLLFLCLGLCSLSSQKSCPFGKYGPNCLKTCLCKLQWMKSCDPITGTCICKTGFKGRRCTEDINECTERERSCPNPLEYCHNTIGSYVCLCKVGATKGLSGSCRPCPGKTYGKLCKKCPCVTNNILSCQKQTGNCVCEIGWQGTKCEESHNDCIPDPCPGKECVDGHKQYSCICTRDERYMLGECRPYKILMTPGRYRPPLGDWINIWFLFSFPEEIRRDPKSSPEWKWTLYANEEEQCDVQLPKNPKRATKDIGVIRDLWNETAPWHFYIAVKMRFSKSENVRLVAKPHSEDYKQMIIHLDYTIRTRAIQQCLTNFNISGTRPCSNQLCVDRHVPHLGRQSYNEFMVHFYDTEDCGESARLSWNFYRLRDNVDWETTKSCINLDQFIRERSGHPRVSDHRSAKETIFSRTLNLGYNIFCVMGYVLNSKGYQAITCGSVKIVPSYKILGHIFPRQDLVVLNCDLDFYMTAEVKEQDLDAELEYIWECSTSTTSMQKCPHWPGAARGRKMWFWRGQFCPSVGWGRDAPPLRLYVTMTAWVKHAPEPEKTKIQLKKEVNLRRGDYHLFIIFKCRQNCAPLIGADQNVKLSAYTLSLLNRQHGHQYRWSVKRLTDPDSFDPSKVADYEHSEHFITKKLEPGHKYRIECRIKNRRKTGYAFFEFETEAAPKGEGCDIKPKFGKAVFTKFTVKCHNYVDTVTRLPLLYRLFQKRKYKLKNWIGYYNTFYRDDLIAYAGEDTISNLTLSSDDIYKISRVEFTMKIVNVLGSSTEAKFEAQILTEDQQHIVTNIVNSLDTYNGGGQEDIRMVDNVATVIGWKSTASKESKIKVRTQLLTNINDFKSDTSESIRQTSVAFQKASIEEAELNQFSVRQGLGAAADLTKYVGRVSHDFTTVRNTAELQLHAASKLMSKSSDFGRDVVRGLYADGHVKEQLLSQNKEESYQGTASFEYAAGTLSLSLNKPKDSVKISTDNVDMGVEMQSGTSEFNLGSDDSSVRFYMLIREMGVLPNENIEGDFQVYKKNPYQFATSDVHGDFPVIKVGFVRHKTKHLIDDKKAKKFRFSRPADVFLDFKKGNLSDPAVYTLYVAVEKRPDGKLYVWKSSCIFVSLKASETSTTVLEMERPHGLELKIQAKYTNLLDVFDTVYNDQMIDYPLNFNESFESSKGTLRRDPNLFFLPQLSKERFKKNTPYYRIEITLKHGQVFSPGILQPLSGEESMKVFGPDVDNDTETLNVYNLSLVVHSFDMACMHFDKKKETFLSDQCFLTMFSTTKLLHCRCVVAAAFTGSFLVKPRLISPLDVALFKEVFRNPLAVSMVLTVWMIMSAVWIWGRNRDRVDANRRLATVLEDNDEDYVYVYLLCVITGWSSKAGTTSNVFLYIKGSWGVSETHLLTDLKRKLFDSGAENWFVLTTAADLGEIQSIVIWTDFSGGHPSWFLQSVFIENMQTTEAWMCLYNQWLSAVFGNKQLQAEVPAMKNAVYFTKTSLQIQSKTRNDLRNEHLWIGMFAKTSYNKFTRVRRLTTALTMLQTMMLLNLMFFGIRDKDDPGQFTEILGQKIHLTSIIIGIETSIIVTVLGLAIGFLFNRIAVRKSRSVEDYLDEDDIKMLKRRREILRRKQNGLWPDHMAKYRARLRRLDSDSDYTWLPPENYRESKSILQLKDRNQTVKFFEKNLNVSAKVSFVQENEESIGDSSSFDENESIIYPQSIESSTVVSTVTTESKSDDVDVESQDKDEAVPSPEAAPFMLPWWFIYFTWPILFCFNLFLGFYIMLYGLDLGYENSVEWVMAFFGGFIFNVLVVQPVKVILMAFLLILVFKQSYTIKEQAPLTKLDEINQLIEVHKREKVLNRRGHMKKAIVSFKAPLNPAEASKVLERLAIESAAREMLRDLFLYSIFMIAMLVLVYGHLDVRQTYLQNENIQVEFLGLSKPTPGNDGDLDDPLAKIVRPSDMWEYIINVTVPRIVPEDDVAALLKIRGSYLIGKARIRQARTVFDNSICAQYPVFLREGNVLQDCSLSMFGGKEETRSYNNTWQIPSGIPKQDMLESPYIHRTAEELNTEAFTGDHGVYSGGGYVQTFLRDDTETVQELLRQIMISDWIDRLTRCIFLEFSMYNPSSDMFSNVMIAFEFDNYGGVYPLKKVKSARFYRREDKNWLQVAEGISLLCILFYTVAEIKNIKDHGFKNRYREFYNWLELAMLLLGYLAMLLYFLRYLAFEEVLQLFRKYGNGQFIDLQAVFYRHEDFHNLMGMLGFVAIIKMLKVTTFNPFMSMFGKSIRLTLVDFCGYSFFTILVMLSFGVAATLMFGSKLLTYATLNRSLMALLFFLLGEPDFPALIAPSVFFGRLFFFSFMVISQYVIINTFIAILREGFEITRYMQSEKENATVKYMYDTITLFLGLTPKNERSN